MDCFSVELRLLLPVNDGGSVKVPVYTGNYDKNRRDVCERIVLSAP